MLLGNYYNTLDAKGRAFIPSKLRYTLGERIMLVKGVDHCLCIFTNSEWDSYVSEYIENVSMAEEEGRKLSRFFYGNTKECEIDKQGRINLPPDYLEYADLDKELVFVGCGKYIEIWDKDIFEKEMSPANLNPSELMKKARQSSTSENVEV